MTTEIFAKISERIAQAAGIEKDKVTLESNFQDLGMDSLDALELLSNLEEEYNIKIPNQELLQIRTVNQAVQSLNKRLNNA